MKYVLIVIISLLCSCSNNIDRSELDSMDYRLFVGTEAERLAVAVANGDVKTIKEEVLNNNIPIDIKNPEYGTTLLMMATNYNNLKSAKCLLELGADPNLCSDTTKTWGDNSVLIASRWITPSPEMLSLLLSYGGDPNSQAKGVQSSNIGKLIPMRDFALEEASVYSIEKVKILIQAGADINKINKYTDESSIRSAIIHNQMEILLYLLQNGADYNKKFIRGDYSKPETTYYECNILDYLREKTYQLDSEKHKQKMEVVKFLAAKGLDYSKAPIPEWIIKQVKKNYPDNWREYLERY